MPNRMLRDWTDSEKINNMNVHCERFFTRLIMKVDDYGCFHADTRLLKANLFPLLLDYVKESDIAKWLNECHVEGLVRLYDVNGKKYLQINDFKQRLDRAKAKFPLPPTNEPPEVVNGIPPEVELEVELEDDTLGGLQPPVVSISDNEKYKQADKTINGIAAFITDNKPSIIEPYTDLWNLFALKFKRPTIKLLPDKRKKKLQTRIRDDSFDFVKVLKKAKESEFLMTGSFFTLDWIIENETNYLKVLEGNYSNKTDQKTPILNDSNYQQDRAKVEAKTARLASL